MSTDPGPASQLIDLKPPQLGALTSVMLLTFAAPVAMPFNIEAIARAFGASNTAAGGVATAELLAISISSLTAAQFAPRLDVRRTILAGLSLVLVANLATLWMPSMISLAVVRAFAGVGCGVVVSVVMSVAGRSREPEFTFGIINSAVGIMGMILSQVLPRSIGAYGLQGAYGVYVVGCLIALPLIRVFPVPAPSRKLAGVGAADSGPGVAGWVALFGLGLVFLGHAALILFVVRIGIAIPLSLDTVGNVFLVGAAFTAVAPLVAGFLGSRLTSTIPVGLILVSLMGCAYLLANAATPYLYYISAPLFAALPLAMMPIILGAFARVDPSGRLTGAHPAFVTLGGALAPSLGGMTSDLGGYPVTGWLTIGCIVAGAAMLLGTARRADQLRRGRAQSESEQVFPEQSLS
jgi:predicted MFS family arabinose efflux permease